MKKLTFFLKMSGLFILRAKVKLPRPLKEYDLVQIKIHICSIKFIIVKKGARETDLRNIH